MLSTSLDLGVSTLNEFLLFLPRVAKPFAMMSNFHSFAAVAVFIVVIAVFQVQGRPRRFYMEENKENSV